MNLPSALDHAIATGLPVQAPIEVLLERADPDLAVRVRPTSAAWTPRAGIEGRGAIPEAVEVAAQRSGRPAQLLRLPGRALAYSLHNQTLPNDPSRVRLRPGVIKAAGSGAMDLWWPSKLLDRAQKR